MATERAPTAVQLREPRATALFVTLLKGSFLFLSPLIAAGKLSPALRSLYKGLLRLLLVLLHDFAEVLDVHHIALCQHIAPRCHQMRNLVLSAFPKHMKLMDPFAPRLKFNMVPEMEQVRCLAPPVLPPVLRPGLQHHALRLHAHWHAPATCRSRAGGSQC
jgi:hypothetical protein